MTSPYRQALAVPGAPRFVAAAFVGRLPISMIGLGTILLVQARTGSYGLAGAVAAGGALAEAVGAPVIGNALDRLGQARVLLACLVVNVCALAGLIAAVRAGAPEPLWFAAAAVTGGFMPPIGACTRARWSVVLRGGPLLTSAFALEAVIDEMIFVLGPVTVTVLAATVSPVAGLGTAGVLAVAGTLALVGQRSTDPGPRARGSRARADMLSRPGTRRLVVTFLAAGSAFGAMDVSMVAFARGHGVAAAAGLLLGTVAAASGASGLVYGARKHRQRVERRFIATALGLAAGLCLPLAAPSVAWMVPAAILAGLSISPALINGNALIQKLVPADALTEGFAWLTTAVVLGVAVGSPVAGRVIDATGPRGGFVVVAASGLIAAVVTVAGARTPAAEPVVPGGARPGTA